MFSFFFLFLLSLFSVAQSPRVSPLGPRFSAREFVGLVKRLEARYPRVSTREMIAKIRKQYYDSAAVPSAPSIKERVMAVLGVAVWDLLIPGSKSVERFPENEPLVRFLTPKHQEQAWGSAGVVDLGHVFSGLDASYSTPPISWIARKAFGFQSGVGPSTWSGDAGSAMTDYFKKHDGKQQTLERFARNFEATYIVMNSQSDMLGNMDGIALARANPNPDSTKLSTMLEDYYIKGKWRRQRYAYFALSQFGSTSLERPRAREIIEREIRLFAEGYWKKSNALGIAGRWFRGQRVWPWTRAEMDYLVDRFILHCKAIKDATN